MTLEKFNECYVEYAKNFAQYRAMDLNFKQVMYMKHSLSSGEFDEWKRQRLIGVGADIVIADYRDSSLLLELILGK